jgi:hypothetical protein
MWLAALTLARRVGSAVPVWAWVIVAALAWGGWQRHRASSAAEAMRAHDAAIAAQIIQRQQADQAETARRLDEQRKATDAAETLSRTARLDAAGAHDAAQRLRQQLATRTAHRRPADPASAAAGDAGALADLLSQCAERYQQVAAVADASIVAGLTCQRAYQSLTAGRPPP